MDDDKKKKKRNKKKKNKLIETADVGLGGGETLSVDQSSISDGRNAQKVNVQDTEVDMDGNHLLSGTEGTNSEQLKDETDSYGLREATLEEAIRQLQEKNDSYVKKEVALEETIKQLDMENAMCLKKEAILEETITGLRNEKASCMQKEEILEDTIIKFQNQNSLHIEKEAGLKENISQLLDEIASLQLKEDSSKETIARLNEDITTLRMQVLELDESKNNLSKENQQLMGNVSKLQLQLQSLNKSISSAYSSDKHREGASKEEDLNSQIEAACVLVDKLIIENAELVEKVNELCIKINKQSMSTMHSSYTEDPDRQLGMAEAERVVDHMSVPNGNVYVLGQEESVEDAFIQDDTIDDSNNEKSAALSANSNEEESGEIVEIVPDDNGVQVLESQGIEKERQAAVPLSDAPLIGAPFRLVSFVAKYVSGADLVAKNQVNLS